MPTASGRSRSTLVVALLALAVAGGTLVVYRRHGGPSRPTEPPDPGPPGTVRTTLATTTTGRRGAYYIPRDHASPRPLLVMLHGTGGTGSAMILRLRALAERERFVALAPDSESVAGVWRVEPVRRTRSSPPSSRGGYADSPRRAHSGASRAQTGTARSIPTAPTSGPRPARTSGSGMAPIRLSAPFLVGEASLHQDEASLRIGKYELAAEAPEHEPSARRQRSWEQGVHPRSPSRHREAEASGLGRAPGPRGGTAR